MTKIPYGFYNSPVGEMIIAQSEAGLCWLGFMVEGRKGNGYRRMKEHFPDVSFVQDDASILSIGDRLIDLWRNGEEASVLLDLKGTEFQRAVWQALLDIPKGQVKSYGAVASDMGKPKAVRAVANAVGNNPVSLIVPCHRVLPKSGELGKYGWGADIKRSILRLEGLQT